jgi:peptidoglycan lytic transglycosylase G
MSLFGRGEDAAQRRARSEEERERARLEREARRRQRTGEMAAVEPEPIREPEPEPHPEPEPQAEPVRAAAPTAVREEPLGVRRAGAPMNMSAAGALGPRAIPPRPTRPARRRRRPIVRVIPVLLVLALGAFAYALFQPFTGSGHGTVVVTVPEGAGASQIGSLLADKGVIDSSFFFGLRARLSGKRGKLRSGTITLRKGMSYGAALDALTKAPAAARTVKLTIPEGRSRREIVPLVKQLGLKGSYLAATSRSPRSVGVGGPASARTLEGYLFPATYELRPGAPVGALVKQQLAAFRDAIRGVSLGYAKRKHLTRYDVLIIASMVEREAQLPSDRPLIAAVIYNRLHQHMPLGIDATIRYALNDWTRPLRVSELQRDSPYNTRTRQGLPPTPIGNPGLSSLQAAAHPAHKPYLFYVVKPCGKGGHAFSSTEAKFQADVARYNAARAANGGKNPKNC